ncbi:hypothetical protein F5X96DRAFT_666334 [Biscogniauxia mediterranea]|nr:hypothetical protein F5X96DRAFT_666334 [Biscogniauxia mediterranea]
MAPRNSKGKGAAKAPSKGKGKEKATASTSTYTSTSTQASGSAGASPGAGSPAGASSSRAGTPRAATPGPSQPGPSQPGPSQQKTSQQGTSQPGPSQPGPSQPARMDKGTQVGTVNYVDKETSPERNAHVVTSERGGYVGNKNAFYQLDVKPGYRSIGTQTADTYVDPHADTGSTFHTEQYIDPGGVLRWENEDRVLEYPSMKYNQDGTPKYY